MIDPRITNLEHEVQALRERLTALESGSTDSIAMIMCAFDLSLTEAHILAHLLKRKHCTKQMILDAVWGIQSEPPTMGTLGVHLWRLRHKMKDKGVDMPGIRAGAVSLGNSTRSQITKMMANNHISNVHVVEIRAGALAQ